MKNYTKVSIFLYTIFLFVNSYAQATLNEINDETYSNMNNVYNYTYWNDFITSNNVSNYKFINITNDYLLSVNYSDLNIHSLDINEFSMTAQEAYKASEADLFLNANSGEIDYAILQNGNVLHEKSSTPTGTHSNGRPFAQLPEFGKWCNRRMIDQIDFTNNAPTSGLFTGIEFNNWHDRFEIKFQLRLTETINNGSLRLSVAMPDAYSYNTDNGELYVFNNTANQGFVLKPGIETGDVDIDNNTITITTDSTNLIAGEQYSASIVFYAVANDINTTYTQYPEKEGGVEVTAQEVLPDSSEASVTYIENEGLYHIDLNSYSMGYNNCAAQEEMQKVDISINNPTNIEKSVKLRINSPGNTTAFSSMINNANGDPSGLHLQVSKNWHGRDTEQLYGGHQITLYTEVIVPPNTTINFDYTKVGAYWGETHPAFSHQLSLVGVGTSSGLSWLEAGIGGYAENVCHSPDLYGGAMQTDWRAFKINNLAQGGTSGGRCGWTGNLGGMDFSTYVTNGSEIRSTETTTEFVKYGPNLSETSVSFFSEDKKVQTTFTFFLNRSDDYNRVYYKVEVEALAGVNFDRFDFYQLGDDNYNRHYAGTVAYGNDEGLLGQYTPSTSTDSNGYTTSEIALTGSNPWIWGGDGERDNGTLDGHNVNANIGMIIREYSATFGGQSFNTPYFRERLRNSAANGRYPAGYSLVTPPEINSLSAGDKIEFIVEATILPKQLADYEGSNENLIQALEAYGNSWELLYRESSRNKIDAYSATNTIDTSYPLTVTTNGNSVNVSITGGIGYVPIVFSGLTDITNPQLWRSTGSCDDGWELVDQSLYGKDFWQVEVDPDTGLFDLIYNVNQDVNNDEMATIHYYLGNTPSDTFLTPASRVADGSWTSETAIEADLGTRVQLAPQIRQNGVQSIGVSADYEWSGPNGFSQNGRVVTLSSLTANDVGEYFVTYQAECGSVNLSFTINSENSLGTSNNTIVHITKRNAPNFAIDGNFGGENSQNIYLWSANTNNVNQQWIEIDRGNGYYSYQKQGTSFCIDGNNGGTNNQNVYLWQCAQNNQNQHWQKVDMGDGSYKLIKRNALGYALNGGNGGANAQNINLYDASNTSQNLQWYITPVEVSAKSVEDNALINDISVFPNPVAATTTIQGAANSTMRIYNMNGQELLKKELLTERETLDLSKLSTGIYYAQVKAEQRIFVLKIIKK